MGSFPVEDRSVGCAAERSAECGDTLQLQVKLDTRGVIVEQARFRAYGCSATIASGSFVTEWLIGRRLDEMTDITAALIVAALELSDEEAHGAVLAARVARTAVDDARCRAH